jgi:alpha-L-fucosidase 2
MAEMLMQSHDGEIQLLPALPSSWPEGSFRGLRARGGVEVDLTWSNGKATGGVVRAARETKIRVRAPQGQNVQGHEVAALAIEAGKPFPLLFSKRA